MHQQKDNSLVPGLIPVMLMAYDHEGGVDTGALERLTDFYLEAGSSGLFTNCYSTEMYQLTQRERLLNARHIVSYVKGRVPIVAVGTFFTTMAENIDAIRQMYDTGVDAVIIVSSKIVTADESDALFMERLDAIFSATGDIPLGIYECPMPYRRIVSADIYKQLLPYGRITYHKDTSCNTDSIRSKLDVLKGSAVGLYEAHMPNVVASLQLGAAGLSAIAGNYYPEVLHWLCQHYSDPDKQDDVRFLEAEFARVDPLIHEAYPVSAKYFLQRRGLDIGLKSRFYTETLTRQQKRNLDELLETVYQWCHRLSIPLSYKAVI